MKLFASDYDGTFLRKKRGIGELTHNSSQVKKWQKKGNIFAFATGRSITGMRSRIRISGHSYDYIVGLNGGIVVDKHGVIIFRRRIKTEVAKEVIEIVKEKTGFYHFTDGFIGHYNSKFKIGRGTYFKNYLKVMSHISPKFNLSFEDAVKRPILQITLSLEKEEEAIEFTRYLNESFKGEISAYSNNCYIDISAENVSKATGINSISKIHNIETRNIYTMGDSFNDISMLKAYKGFCPEGTNEEVAGYAKKMYKSVGDAIRAIRT